MYFSTTSTTFFPSVFNIPATLLNFSSSLLTYFKLACPVVAVILRVPEAIPLSDSILNNPISPVDLTCAPPQSSIEYPSISTTRTTSPYLSEKSAIAPLFFASSIFSKSILTFKLDKIMSFTAFSIFSIISGSIAS